MSTAYPKERAKKKRYYPDDDDLVSATKKAEDLGLVVVLPKADELFVDIDHIEDLHLLVDHVTRLPGATYIVRPSPSGDRGRYHVTVTMPRGITPLERICLQAILGSDRLRELLDSNGGSPTRLSSSSSQTWNGRL